MREYSTSRIFAYYATPKHSSKVAHFCSTKISQDVRDYANAKGIADEDTLKLGMEEKSQEFLQEGAAIYHEV